MAFERNDIVNKTRLAGELGEELMGYEHNDIVTVDVMEKAIAEGGGGGGGGGDMSTATVTVVATSPDASGQFYGAVVDEDNNFTTNSWYMDTGEPFKVVLYKGSALASIDASVDSVSGDIQDMGRDGYLITGDCTITISEG